jgi:hypothetical protein
MVARNTFSDDPAFLLSKAFITGPKIFYATSDGNVNKKTIVCTDLTSIADQDGNQVHIVDPNSGAYNQSRDITGATTAGTINVNIAFDAQITEDTGFIITGIRSTPVEVAAFEAWVKTALGIEWDGTPDLYDVLVSGGIPSWPAAANIANDISIAQAIRAILTSMVGGDDYDGYTKVNNTANASIDAVFQNFATLFAANDINTFNPTIQGAERTNLELALAALATYISAAGAALSIKVNNNDARTNLEQVWEDYLAVIGCDNANVFNPSIGGSARTTVEAALAAIGTIIGNPSGDTLTSITAKLGDIARSVDLVLGARWDSSGDLGTDIGNIITAISSIQNNTRFTAAVPVQMCKPDAGDEAFRMASNLYDTSGDMEDPTNNEILVRVITDAGTYITDLYKENALSNALDNPTDDTTFPPASGWRAMEREDVGKFYLFIKVANDATEQSLTVEFGWTEDSKNNYQYRKTEIADVHGDLSALLGDVGDASGSTLGSLYSIVGNPSASLATTILDDIDGRTNTKTLHGLLGVPDAAGKAVYTNIGDFQGQTNLQTLLAALGIPDVSGKPLYTCLVTDRLDSATYGLSALNDDLDAIQTDLGDFSAQSNLKSLLAVLGSGWNTANKDLYTALITDRLDSATYGLSAIETLVDDLEGRLTADRAGYLDNINNANLATIADISTLTSTEIAYLANINNANLATIADISTLTATEIAHLDADISSRSSHGAAEVRQSVCLVGDPASSIGKILYDFYITRLTAARAGYLDELDFDLDARLGTPVADIATDIATALAAINALNNITAANVWETNISAYAGAGYAGTYLKTLYDDWLNGGRLDLLIDAITTDTEKLYDAALDTAPVDGSLASFVATGGTALGTRLPASKSLYDAELGNIDAVNRAAGKPQIAHTTIDLNQAANTYDLFTGTTQDVLIESLTLRLPNVDVSDDADITSISVQTDDTTAQEFISSDTGVKGNLTAEAQLTWPGCSGAKIIKAGTKIQLTIAGGAADAETVCDVVVRYRAITSGGYLAA